MTVKSVGIWRLSSRTWQAVNQCIKELASSSPDATRSGRCNLGIIRSLPVCALLVLSLEAEASKFRLGEATRPTRYRIELTVIPDAPTYSGTVEIDLQLRAALSEIWLNAHGLTIHEANLTAGGKLLPGRILTEGKDLAGFRVRAHP